MDHPVKIILLAAGGISDLPRSAPSAVHTSLEWLLSAYGQNGIPHSQIAIVGGRHIESIGAMYPDITFFFNPEWQETHTVASLYLAKDLLLQNDCIVSYSDTVYRPNLIAKLLRGTGDLRVVIDTEWRTRYPGRTPASLQKAEKVWLKERAVFARASRRESDSAASGELTGLLYVSRKAGKAFVDVYEQSGPSQKFHEARSIRTAGFTDLLTALAEKGIGISPILTCGDWAEMDAAQDFASFVFGTKSETLERLRPVLKTGKILPQLSFTVAEWKQKKKILIGSIQDSFDVTHLVIRSSSRAEDTLSQSNAGRFTSVLGVSRRETVSIENAVDAVIASFGTDTGEDQVLVQPQIKNVAISGVVFTCDLRTGGPYYVVNYDNSGSTDSVTAGRRGDHELHYIYKGGIASVRNRRIQQLVAAAAELERLTGNPAIDVEFACDTQKKLFVFQARPIASTTALEQYGKHDIRPFMQQGQELIRQRMKRKPHLSGTTTVLGDMPDWNPAELIGSHPKPLAESLFTALIMRDGWRLARKILGYHDPVPEQLMVMVCGHPYIDVRNSLNSYAPDTLPEPLREKVVNEAICFLKAHPELHDKLEFSVATTCFTPLIHERNARWKRAGMSPQEIRTLKDHLRRHTEKMIRGEWHTVGEMVQMVRALDKRRSELMASDGFDEAYKVHTLLEDCRLSGTIPFSAIDRLAFIGSTFMRSFVEGNSICKQSYDAFLGSIDTVVSQMGRDLGRVSGKQMPLREFLKEYGHLRPGTFEIESYRYDENPKLYFSNIHAAREGCRRKKFTWKDGEKSAMQDAMRKSGASLTVNEICDLVVQTTQARELSKFLFSRNISDALSLIVRWGVRCGLARNDLSFLRIEEIPMLMNMPSDRAVRLAADLIRHRREEYAIHQQIMMPQLITRPADIEHVRFAGSRPNFITSHDVSGATVVLDAGGAKKNIRGKIVLIESADPGYDWIFMHNIKGLITKYGGAGSHMAIRAAEFDLPAAIGVGARFEEILSQSTIRLSCANHIIS